MPDDPTLQAVMYGPLVLAGKLGTAGLTRKTCAHYNSAAPSAELHRGSRACRPLSRRKRRS